MHNIYKKLKRRAGVILLGLFVLFILTNPIAFFTMGGDIGHKVIMSAIGLVLFSMAVSQADRHWSHPDPEKKVSLSKFMAEEAEANHKVVIYASLFISVAIILAAVIFS